MSNKNFWNSLIEDFKSMSNEDFISFMNELNEEEPQKHTKVRVTFESTNPVPFQKQEKDAIHTYTSVISCSFDSSKTIYEYEYDNEKANTLNMFTYDCDKVVA